MKKNVLVYVFAGVLFLASSLYIAIKFFDIEIQDFFLAGQVSSRRISYFSLQKPESYCSDNKAYVLLNWMQAKNASYYTIQRRMPDQIWQDIKTQIPSSSTTYIDDTSNANQMHYYRIKAINETTSRTSNKQNIKAAQCTPSPSAAPTTPTPTATPSPAPASSPTPAPTQAANATPAPTPTPNPMASRTPYWGAYTGWQIGDADALEAKIGKEINHRTLFVHWGNENEFPTQIAQQLKSEGKTLIIFWQAMDYNVSSTTDLRFNYDSILAGRWDSYIFSFAQSAKNFDGPVILIPFEEMNGNWYTWSGTENSNTPQKHISAYRYVRGFFRDAANVKFGWAINHESVPDTLANRIEAYYPGSEYVDYVGVNGFNFGNPWQSFSEVFSDALNRLKTYSKPIYIFSFACAPGAQKAAWITDALSVQIPKYPEIVGWNWFNEDKETDWRIWSDANSLQAFVSALP